MSIDPPVLRQRTGFYAWLAWKDGIGDWTPYGPSNPSVRPNVPKNISRYRPTWFHRREEWWEARRLAEANANAPKPKLYALVRDESHIDAHSPAGVALCTTGIPATVLLQFGQHDQYARNVPRFAGWAAGWRAQGARVGSWFRVEDIARNGYPLLPFDEQWPNIESADEISAMRGTYSRMDCAGVITLGKCPGVLPPVGKPLMAESFKDTAISDKTITNSVRFWLDAGVPRDRIIPGIQTYDAGAGRFGTPVEQAREVRANGICQAWIYTLDEVSAAEVRGIAAILAAPR